MLAELKELIVELPQPILEELGVRLDDTPVSHFHTIWVVQTIFELILDDVDSDTYVDRQELISFVQRFTGKTS